MFSSRLQSLAQSGRECSHGRPREETRGAIGPDHLVPKGESVMIRKVMVAVTAAAVIAAGSIVGAAARGGGGGGGHGGGGMGGHGGMGGMGGHAGMSGMSHAGPGMGRGAGF